MEKKLKYVYGKQEKVDVVIVTPIDLYESVIGNYDAFIDW